MTEGWADPEVRVFLFAMENELKEEGIYMTLDIICDKRLDFFEKTLLSIYHSYGEDITCNEVLRMLGEKPSHSTYHRAKRRLRELGMIGNDHTTKTSEL